MPRITSKSCISRRLRFASSSLSSVLTIRDLSTKLMTIESLTSVANIKVYSRFSRSATSWHAKHGDTKECLDTGSIRTQAIIRKIVRVPLVIDFYACAYCWVNAYILPWALDFRASPHGFFCVCCLCIEGQSLIRCPISPISHI